MRYFKPPRIALYKHMVGAIKKIAPNVFVYLCMEDDEIWQDAFDFTPAEKGDLEQMFDQTAISHCGIQP